LAERKILDQNIGEWGRKMERTTHELKGKGSGGAKGGGENLGGGGGKGKKRGWGL